MSDEDYSALFCPTPYEHEIRGQNLRFYPNHVGKLSKLRPFITAIAGAIATFAIPDRNTDTGYSTKSTYDPTATMKGPNGNAIPRIRESMEEHPGITTQMAQMRDKQRQAAIESLIVALTSDKNHATLAELVIDSLQDEEFVQKLTPGQLVAKMDVELLTGFAAGVIGANMQGIQKNADPLKRGLAIGSQIPGVESAPQPTQPATSGAGSL